MKQLLCFCAVVAATVRVHSRLAKVPIDWFYEK